MTNITELVEYALLPHSDSVSKPRALNTFLDGIAEIGVDRGLIKNKKALSSLIEKKQPKFACQELWTGTLTTVGQKERQEIERA